MKLPVLVLLAWSFAPLHAATIANEPFPPAKLTSLYIEKDEKGKSTTLRLVGDAVVFTITMGNQVLDSTTVHPSGDDWFKFIQTINGAKVYNWSPKYEYPGQGPTWVIDFVMEDRKFYSEGTNEYPKEGHEADPQIDPKHGPSVPFEIFWQAVLTLAGKAPPKKAGM